MKRIFTLLALIGLFISASAQTRTLVTLSHDGELTFFDKISALEDALVAAVDGDKIYLSSGKFGARSSSITINKKVSIVGNGYDSHILPDIMLQSEVSNLVKYIAPAFEGVRIERLSHATGGGEIDPIEIKACKIAYFNSNGFSNLLIDRCFIDEFVGNNNKNIHIVNSKIKDFKGYHCEILENCNIGRIGNGQYPAYAISCIINEAYLNNDNAKYENCMIWRNTYSSKNGDLRNCYFLSAEDTEPALDDNLEAYYSLEGYLGTDGTQVGIYGGEWYPFSTIPTVPTVNAAASSVTYDPENNQLKVSITVAE